MRENTPDVTIHVDTPPEPITPVIVETPPPEPPPPDVPTIDHHAEEIGRFDEWRRQMDEWREQREAEWNQQNESTLQLQETLSNLSNSVSELNKKVSETPNMREVILPLPIAETSEENPDNPDNADPVDEPENQTANTSPVPASPQIRNDSRHRQENKRVVLHRRRGRPNT
jgi:hypothetical protein